MDKLLWLVDHFSGELSMATFEDIWILLFFLGKLVFVECLSTESEPYSFNFIRNDKDAVVKTLKNICCP